MPFKFFVCLRLIISLVFSKISFIPSEFERNFIFSLTMVATRGLLGLWLITKGSILVFPFFSFGVLSSVFVSFHAFSIPLVIIPFR